MFHMPVEKHGGNSHLRQKGKIAEIVLSYGDSVGALKAMSALDMGFEEKELQPSWIRGDMLIPILYGFGGMLTSA